MALSAVLANESAIVNQFAPSLAQLLGGTELQLCSLFVGFHDCSNDFEQVGCAINCNPDSANYVRQSEGVGTNPIFSMCDSFATKMFDDCKGLPVPGTAATFGQFLNSKERMLNKSFGAIFSALGYRSTSLEIVHGATGCYNGPSKIPPRVICCDPLIPPANCPAGTVDNPQFAKLFNRTLDKKDCAAYASVPDVPVIVQPAPSSSPCPNGLASSNKGDDGSSSTGNCGSMSPSASSINGVSGGSSDNNGKGNGRFAGTVGFHRRPHQNTPAAARSVTCHRDRVFTQPLQALRSSQLTRAASLPRLLKFKKIPLEFNAVNAVNAVHSAISAVSSLWDARQS
ncbi:unnamed protein product [Closterium sp. NIES-54]